MIETQNTKAGSKRPHAKAAITTLLQVLRGKQAKTKTKTKLTTTRTKTTIFNLKKRKIGLNKRLTITKNTKILSQKRKGQIKTKIKDHKMPRPPLEQAAAQTRTSKSLMTKLQV